ncbi:unnamed protein product [Albugo candida]|uniref:Uncharacterized protein n=1 Tax=Albugo candida TaxID=65357 RepID=A0A024GIN7_9STRA|nr:unnamed protein product [Albugo candida]|eukprot:CCI46377.1 unnamed protein product [Albugo candida]
MISLKSQMATTHIIGYLIVVGPQFSSMTESLLQQHSRKQVSYSLQRPMNQCEQTYTQPNVLTSASPLGKCGVLLRFQGNDTESTMNHVKEQLKDLEHIVGFIPYQEGR